MRRDREFYWGIYRRVDNKWKRIEGCIVSEAEMRDYETLDWQGLSIQLEEGEEILVRVGDLVVLEEIKDGKEVIKMKPRPIGYIERMEDEVVYVENIDDEVKMEYDPMVSIEGEVKQGIEDESIISKEEQDWYYVSIESISKKGLPELYKKKLRGGIEEELKQKFEKLNRINRKVLRMKKNTEKKKKEVEKQDEKKKKILKLQKAEIKDRKYLGLRIKKLKENLKRVEDIKGFVLVTYKELMVLKKDVQGKKGLLLRVIGVEEMSKKMLIKGSSKEENRIIGRYWYGDKIIEPKKRRLSRKQMLKAKARKKEKEFFEALEGKEKKVVKEQSVKKVSDILEKVSYTEERGVVVYWRKNLDEQDFIKFTSYREIDGKYVKMGELSGRQFINVLETLLEQQSESYVDYTGINEELGMLKLNKSDISIQIGDVLIPEDKEVEQRYVINGRFIGNTFNVQVFEREQLDVKDKKLVQNKGEEVSIKQRRRGLGLYHVISKEEELYMLADFRQDVERLEDLKVLLGERLYSKEKIEKIEQIIRYWFDEIER